MHPTQLVQFPNGQVGMTWSDASESYVTARALRAACPCAVCVDEMTGVRRLDPDTVGESVRIESWTPVGSYAVQIRWTDGHETGLYTFDLLRRLGEPER